MPKKPYTGLLKADRVSIFKLDPTLARWILLRPAVSQTANLYGHAVNEQYNGILFRDEDEARAAQRRMDINAWDLQPFALDPTVGQLAPFNPSEEEIQALPLIERPYLWMFRTAQGYQSVASEVPVSPTRRELFHFIRDKSVAVAAVARDFTSLQMQVVELQKAMASMAEAQGQPGQAVPSLAPAPSPPPPPASPTPTPQPAPSVASVINGQNVSEPAAIPTGPGL